MAVRTWSLHACTQEQACMLCAPSLRLHPYGCAYMEPKHMHTGASMEVEEESVRWPTRAHRSKHGGRVSS
eukprot:scaffold60510_cov24-Tisochrysis_lutea.AAC.1